MKDVKDVKDIYSDFAYQLESPKPEPVADAPAEKCICGHPKHISVNGTESCGYCCNEYGLGKRTLENVCSAYVPESPTAPTQTIRELLQLYRAKHKECKDLTGHPDALKSQAKDWRCDLCKQADPYLQPDSLKPAREFPISKCKMCGDRNHPRDKYGYCSMCVEGMERTNGD